MRKKFKSLILCLSITSVAVAFASGCSINTNKSVENDVGYADKYIDLHLHLDGAITPEIAKKAG